MANPEIVSYIKKNLKKFPKDKVRSELISAGWNEKEVDEAFKDSPAPETKKVDEISGKSVGKAVFRVFMFLGSVIIGFVGIILLFFLNPWIGRLILLLSIAGLGYGVYDSWKDQSKLKYPNIAIKLIVGLIYLFVLLRSL